MKIAVTGKGGVGKTCISALLAMLYAEEGRRVIAVDADPDPSLNFYLGFPPGTEVTPIIKMKEMIAGRMGTSPGERSAYFRMNPRVDDIPEQYSLVKGNVRLLVMGTVAGAGTGCTCAENAFLRELLNHLLLDREEVVIVDLVAGVEHLGRGTAEGVDAMVVVTEPNLPGLETSRRILKLAPGLNIPSLPLVANKVASGEEMDLIQAHFPDKKIAAWIPYSDTFRLRAGSGQDITRVDPAVLEEVIKLKQAIDKEL